MKYIVSILLIILFTGCQLRTGKTAQKIQAVSKTCTSIICISAARSINADQPKEDAPVVQTSLIERTGSILTW